MDIEEKTALALEYLARGWSVIPVAKTKIPLIKWTRYQTERADEKQIRSWFSTPDVQIGIVTGAISNLTVIDLEPGADAGFLKGIDTYIVQTGSGGYHYYFQHEPDVPNAVRTLPLVDLRSEGGYVVAAGSESEKGPYSAVSEEPVVKMPDEVKKKVFPPRPVYDVDNGTWKEPYDVLHYEGYGEGQRNNEMTRYVGAVLRRTHPTLWDLAAWNTVVEANKKNTPPLKDFELKAIFDSIKGRERAKPTPGFQLGNMAGEEMVIPEAPEPLQVEDEIGHVFEVAARQPIDTEVYYKTNIELFDAALDGGFSPGDLVVIVGRPGNGKTSFAQDIAVAFSRTEEPVPALFFSYEVMPRPLAKKFTELGLTIQDPIFMPYNTDNDTTDWIERISLAAQESLGVKAVFIDHLQMIRSKNVGKNDSKADRMEKIIQELKNLAKRHGLVVVLMAHVRKTLKKTPDLDDIKDTSGVAQLADSVFLVERLREANNKNMANYFSEQTRIMMLKNRRTGQTPVAICEFMNGHFITNPEIQEKYQEYLETEGTSLDDFYGDKS